MTFKKINFVTLNSGAREIIGARDFASSAVEKTVADVVTPGKGRMRGMFADSDVANFLRSEKCSFASWQLKDGGKLLASCVLCWGATHAKEAWDVAEKVYFSAAEKNPAAFSRLGNEAPEKPPGTPWMAILLWPSVHRTETPTGSVDEPCPGDNALMDKIMDEGGVEELAKLLGVAVLSTVDTESLS